LDRALNELVEKGKLDKYLKNQPQKKRTHPDEKDFEEDDS